MPSFNSAAALEQKLVNVPLAPVPSLVGSPKQRKSILVPKQAESEIFEEFQIPSDIDIDKISIFKENEFSPISGIEFFNNNNPIFLAGEKNDFEKTVNLAKNQFMVGLRCDTKLSYINNIEIGLITLPEKLFKLRKLEKVEEKVENIEPEP